MVPRPQVRTRGAHQLQHAGLSVRSGRVCGRDSPRAGRVHVQQLVLHVSDDTNAICHGIRTAFDEPFGRHFGSISNSNSIMDIGVSDTLSVHGLGSFLDTP